MAHDWMIDMHLAHDIRIVCLFPNNLSSWDRGNELVVQEWFRLTEIYPTRLGLVVLLLGRDMSVDVQLRLRNFRGYSIVPRLSFVFHTFTI